MCDYKAHSNQVRLCQTPNLLDQDNLGHGVWVWSQPGSAWGSTTHRNCFNVSLITNKSCIKGKTKFLSRSGNLLNLLKVKTLNKWVNSCFKRQHYKLSYKLIVFLGYGFFASSADNPLITQHRLIGLLYFSYCIRTTVCIVH